MPYCQLSSYTEFSVKQAATLFEESGCLGRFDPRKGIPDHSLLTWKVTLNQTVTPNYNVSQAVGLTPHSRKTKKGLTPHSRKTKKYDLHSIPPDFMMTEEAVSQARGLVSVSVNSSRR